MYWLTLLVAFPAVCSALVPHLHDSHSVDKRLPAAWHHPDDHPVHALFKRAPGDGSTYPIVGTPTWSSAFPATSPDVNQLPAQWVAALNAAVSAGKIPNIPQSSNTPGVNPVYPQGINPGSPEVCSATYKCRIPGDIWDAPANFFGTSFDDGPTQASPRLLQFLQTNNEKATHFMIGVNIMANPQLFLDIFNAGHDIAVHTWTHPYMTTLTNLQIVAQLGWTSELIRNSTGGRVPRYWRPPFGDSDTRVRAIAKEVFGLETVIWNQDTEDWSLTTNGTTLQAIHNSFVQWLAAPKTTGIITLEHETSDQSVSAFIDAYALIKPAGWKTASLLSLVGNGTYQNSKDSNSPVSAADILAGSALPNFPAAGSSSSSSTPSSQSSSSSSTQTGTTTASQTSSATTGGAKPTQTNAASSFKPCLSCNLSKTLLSLSAPAIVAVLSLA